MVSLIVAVAENGAIGKNNDLIWYLPKDLHYFKSKTKGHTVIMGRKNYFSIPEKYRPLPGRDNVVVTFQEQLEAPGCEVVNSVEEALKIARQKNDNEPFIIGGGQIYRYALEHNLVDRMYITRVHQSFDGDTFFPEVDFSHWQLIDREDHKADHRHKYDFSFCIWDRKPDSREQNP